MAYAQGTIYDPNPNASLQGSLDALMTSAGWTVEDEFTPSGDYRVKVYKSAAADNQCGYDWYVSMHWSVTGTSTYFTILSGSEYNDTTKVLNGFAGAAADRPAAAGGSRSSETGYAYEPVSLDNVELITDGTVAYGSSAGSRIFSYTNGRVIPPYDAFGFWASVTLDHFSIAYTGTVSNAVAYFTLDVAANYGSYYNGAETNLVCAYGSGDVFEDISVNKTPAMGDGVAGWIFRGSRGEFLRSPALPRLYTDNGYGAVASRPRMTIRLNLGNQTTATDYGIIPNDQTTGNTTFAFDDYLAPHIFVGDAIDFWQVNGGSRGDTVNIAGVTHVIMGSNGPAVELE